MIQARHCQKTAMKACESVNSRFYHHWQPQFQVSSKCVFSCQTDWLQKKNYPIKQTQSSRFLVVTNFDLTDKRTSHTPFELLFSPIFLLIDNILKVVSIQSHLHSWKAWCTARTLNLDRIQDSAYWYSKENIPYSFTLCQHWAWKVQCCNY